MSNIQVNADALIIGARPTGAVAAKRLAEAGVQTVVLKQGDWPDYTPAAPVRPQATALASRLALHLA
jgi:choline dehydrogenase-like flavoprotein